MINRISAINGILAYHVVLIVENKISQLVGSFVENTAGKRDANFVNDYAEFSPY